MSSDFPKQVSIWQKHSLQWRCWVWTGSSQFWPVTLDYNKVVEKELAEKNNDEDETKALQQKHISPVKAGTLFCTKSSLHCRHVCAHQKGCLNTWHPCALVHISGGFMIKTFRLSVEKHGHHSADTWDFRSKVNSSTRKKALKLKMFLSTRRGFNTNTTHCHRFIPTCACFAFSQKKKKKKRVLHLKSMSTCSWYSADFPHKISMWKICSVYSSSKVKDIFKISSARCGFNSHRIRSEVHAICSKLTLGKIYYGNLRPKKLA